MEIQPDFRDLLASFNEHEVEYLIFARRRTTMAPARTAVKFTYAEYRTLPETGPRYQLMEGELIMTPAPSSRHQIVSGRFFTAISTLVAMRKLGVVLYAPLDVLLSEEDVLQPDLLFVSNARRHLLALEGLRGGPDLCVEIVSESSRALDRGAKRVLYARHDVIEYWLVDPDANTVELYRLREDPSRPVRTFAASDTLTSSLLPGLTLALRDVFLP